MRKKKIELGEYLINPKKELLSAYSQACEDLYRDMELHEEEVNSHGELMIRQMSSIEKISPLKSSTYFEVSEILKANKHIRVLEDKKSADFSEKKSSENLSDSGHQFIPKTINFADKEDEDSEI